jgi:hypothetical protein
MKITVLLVVLLLSAACVPRPGSATKIDPCSLITKEDAAAAWGGDVELAPTPDHKTCAYNLLTKGSANTTRYGSIVVKVVTSESPEFQKFGLATDSSTEAQPISGVGERAVLFQSKDRPDEGARAMQVLKGNVYLAIGMATSNPPVSVDVLKQLAVKAVSRLP